MTSTPVTILVLRGVHPFNGAYAPPRLVMRSVEGITRDQNTIVRTLTDAYAETVRRGRHRKPLSADEIENLIGDIYAAVTDVRPWGCGRSGWSPCCPLSAFLDDLDDVLAPDDGAERFGNLPLQALERIASMRPPLSRAQKILRCGCDSLNRAT